MSKEEYEQAVRENIRDGLTRLVARLGVLEQIEPKTKPAKKNGGVRRPETADGWRLGPYRRRVPRVEIARVVVSRGALTMGRRILKVSAELLVDFLKGLQDGPPRYFAIVSDAVPADARIVTCRSSLYWPNVVEIGLESVTFDGDDGEISPLFQAVELKP
jgi:hypothetical protein